MDNKNYNILILLKHSGTYNKFHLKFFQKIQVKRSLTEFNEKRLQKNEFHKNVMLRILC